MYLLRFVSTIVYEPAHYDTLLIRFSNSSYLQHLNIKTNNVCKVKYKSMRQICPKFISPHLYVHTQQ